MKKRAYIETTVISYLASRDSRDVVLLACQQVTREWWASTAQHCDLYASQLVVEEAGRGDPSVAGKRLELVQTLQLLVPDEKAECLARKLVEQGPLPSSATDDALHIAIAAVNGMDYLVTWNCRHIANAEIRGEIESLCRQEGFDPPTICTPMELMEEENDT